MVDAHEIRLLGEGILYRDYQNLARYFRNAWGQPHEYIVLIGRQSFDLNAAFSAVYEDEWKNNPHKERVVTDNALLLHAQDIALFYKEKGFFPSILLIKDTTLHGTELSKLLRSFRDAILTVLYPDTLPTQDELFYLNRNLAFSIDISIYATDKSEFLLEDIFEQRLVCEKRLYSQEFRSLSQQISCFLQKIGTANVPFPLVYHLPKTPVCPPGWITQEWKYRGVEETVFMQRGYGACIPTVRFRKIVNNSDVCLTGQVLFGRLAVGDFFGTCQMVQKIFKDKGLDYLSRTLSDSMLQEQRIWMLSFLVSAVCLRDFIGEAFDFQNFDLESSVRYIGKGGEEIEKMLRDKGLCEQLRMVTLERLSKSVAPILDDPIAADLSSVNYDSEISYIESRLFELVMKGEETAYRLIQSRGLNPSIEKYSMTSVENILSWNHTGFLWEIPKIRPSVTRRLACLLTLADSGLASFGFDCSSSTIYPVVKAENLSMATIPRRLAILIPALALLDRDAWRMNAPSENAVLDFLREQDEYEAGEWVRIIYKCGQTPTGWDFQLLDSRDWNKDRDGTYLSFVKNIELQKREFLNLAEQFIQNKL